MRWPRRCRHDERRRFGFVQALSAVRRRGDGARSSRTLKSCGPGAATLALSSRWCLRITRTTVARKPVHRGDHV